MKIPGFAISGKYVCLLFTAPALILILSGCSVGPDYRRPVTAADEFGSFVNLPVEWSDANSIGADVGQWWLRLGDPCLGGLVDRAIANNNTLKKAAANLAASEALYRQATGARLPWIDYSFNRTRQKTSIEPSGFIPGGSSRRVESINTTYSQSLSISWVADIFGKLRRAESAGRWEYFASEADYLALSHAVIAEVVNTRIELATQQRLYEIAVSNVENWIDSLEIVQRRYDNGVASPLEVYLARENLANSRSQVPLYESNAVRACHALDVLTGVRPGIGEPTSDSLPDLPELEPVGVGLSASLLDRRPDVRAAELRLAAATDRIGVSVASLYPDLTLTGSGGIVSSEFKNIADSDGLVYSAVMNLLAPLWRGGQLRAGVDVSQARAKAAASEYAQTVLNAIREVEDALVSEHFLAQRAEYLQQRVEQALKAEQLARERYSRGVERVLEVLETERRRRLAQNELVVTKSQLWRARVNLYLAIGGDWDLPVVEPSMLESFTE